MVAFSIHINLLLGEGYHVPCMCVLSLASDEVVLVLKEMATEAEMLTEVIQGVMGLGMPQVPLNILQFGVRVDSRHDGRGKEYR